MGKQWSGPRIPECFAGIQVNYCKNPLCLNFGHPASQNPQPRGPGSSSRGRDAYTVKSEPDGKVRLDCNLCGETLPLKSNTAIHEEHFRLTAYLAPRQDASCPDEKCRNSTVSVSTPKAYQSSAFCQKVMDKRCDAFFVRVNKELTINEKRRLKADSQREMTNLRESDPILAELSDKELRHIIIKGRMQELVGIGKWNDRWLFYPFPDMSEPEKAICWLTDLHDHPYDNDHLARLYSKATLHGIDRFFMQARRRLSLLERPISSASSGGRKWHGYSAYNPAMIGKVLDIFRVFYNYIEAGEDKKTPAMRLGLADAASYSDILKIGSC